MHLKAISVIGNATPKPLVMSLSGPIRRLISEEESLRIGHLWRQRMHSARCSMLCYMRIGEPDIGMRGPSSIAALRHARTAAR